MLNHKEQERLDRFKAGIVGTKAKTIPSQMNYVARKDWGDDIKDFEQKEKFRIEEAVGKFGVIPPSLRR